MFIIRIVVYLLVNKMSNTVIRFVLLIASLFVVGSDCVGTSPRRGQNNAANTDRRMIEQKQSMLGNKNPSYTGNVSPRAEEIPSPVLTIKKPGGDKGDCSAQAGMPQAGKQNYTGGMIPQAKNVPPLVLTIKTQGGDKGGCSAQAMTPQVKSQTAGVFGERNSKSAGNSPLLMKGQGSGGSNAGGGTNDEEREREWKEVWKRTDVPRNVMHVGEQVSSGGYTFEWEMTYEGWIAYVQCLVDTLAASAVGETIGSKITRNLKNNSYLEQKIGAKLRDGLAKMRTFESDSLAVFDIDKGILTELKMLVDVLMGEEFWRNTTDINRRGGEVKDYFSKYIDALIKLKEKQASMCSGIKGVLCYKECCDGDVKGEGSVERENGAGSGKLSIQSVRAVCDVIEKMEKEIVELGELRKKLMRDMKNATQNGTVTGVDKMINAKKAQIEKLTAVLGGQEDILQKLNEACQDVDDLSVERSEETYGNGQVVLSSIAVLKKQVQELKDELSSMKHFDEERKKAEGTLFDFAKSISCDSQYVIQRISTSRMMKKQKEGLLYRYEGKTIEQMQQERDIEKCVSCLRGLFDKKRVTIRGMGEMIDEYKRCIENGTEISDELAKAIDTFGNTIKLHSCQEMIVMQQSIEGLYRSAQLLSQVIMNDGKMGNGSEINEDALENEEKNRCVPEDRHVDKKVGRSMKDYTKCKEVFDIVKRCCAHVKKREKLMSQLISEYMVIRNFVKLKIDRDVSDMGIGDHGEVFMKVSEVIEDGQKKLEEADCEIKKLKEVLEGLGKVVKVNVNEGGGKDFYELLKERVEKLVKVVKKWGKENQEYEKQVEMLNGQLQEMKQKTKEISEVKLEYDELSSRFRALTNQMVQYSNQEKGRVMKLKNEFVKPMYSSLVSLNDVSNLNVDSGIELLANAVDAAVGARDENAVKLRSMNSFFYSIVSAVDDKTEQSISGSGIEKDACERVQKKVKLLARMNGKLREWYIENNSKGGLNTVGEEDDLVYLIRECIERKEDDLKQEYRDVAARNIEILDMNEDLEKQNGELIEQMKKMNEMQEKLKRKLLMMKKRKVDINNIVEALKEAGKGEVRENNVTEVLREFVEGSNATAQEVESVKQALGVEENVNVVKVAQDKANELKELKEQNDKVRSIFNAGGDVDIADVARRMADKVEELENQNDELRKKDEDVKNMLDCEEGADVRESAQAVKSELDSLRSDRGRLCEIFGVNDNGKINVVDEIRKKDDEKNKVIGDLENRLIVIGASVGAESDGSDIENKVQEQGNRLNSLEKQNKNLTKTIENVGIAFGWNVDDIDEEIEDLKAKLDSVEVNNDTEGSSSADGKNKENLQAKIDALIERCKILQAQSKDAMNKNEALSNTVRQIAQEVGVNMDKNGDGNNVVNAVAQLKETVAEQEQQINYVNENIVRGLMDDKDSDIDEDRLRKVSKVVDDISKASDVIKSRNGAFSNWQETIDGLMNENEELSAENNVFNSIANDVDAKSAEELRKKVEGLKKTQEEIEKKLDGGNSSGNLVDDIASLKHELDELREQIEAAKSALGNTNGETESNWVDWVSDLKRNNENLIGQLNDVNNAVGGDSSKGISERMEELKRRIGELTGTNYGTLSEGIEGLGILYNDLNTAKESVFAQLNDAQNENRELQSKVDTIGSIIGANAEDDMQADVQNLIDDYNGAKDLLNSAGCAGNGSLQSCVSAIIKSRDDAENERNRLMAQVDAVASIVGSENVVEDAEKMKEVLNKANEEVSNAKKALWVTGDDEEDLSDGINALKEQVNESGKRIETLESENEKWRQQDEKIWELAKIRMLERRLRILQPC